MARDRSASFDSDEWPSGSIRAIRRDDSRDRGHAVGDQVLVAFARRLNEFCRALDTLVRWGGEEFLLVVAGVEPAKWVPVWSSAAP